MAATGASTAEPAADDTTRKVKNSGGGGGKGMMKKAKVRFFIQNDDFRMKRRFYNANDGFILTQ